MLNCKLEWLQSISIIDKFTPKKNMINLFLISIKNLNNFSVLDTFKRINMPREKVWQCDKSNYTKI
jgi:hypothetical protein